MSIDASVARLVFLAALAVSLGLKLWLSRRQIRNVAAHRDRVPEGFAGHVSVDEHQRAADYTVSRMRLGRASAVLGTLLVLLWTLAGGINTIDGWWAVTGWPTLAAGTAVILSVLFINALIELPLAAYSTFGIEQRFGFNRMTVGTFVGDLAREAVLLLLLGGPLVFVALWLMGRAGNLWWFYLWLVWMGFTLVLTWAYPRFIAPLFNRFSPLENAELKERIEQLLTRCGFRSRGIFVMDGSRRSAHGNAYFTGVGSNKRIVFFDTLLDSLEPEQVEAVLAHELGHFRRHHILKRLLLAAATSLIGLAVLGWLTTRPWFYHGLGVNAISDHSAILLFLFAVPAFTFPLSPLTSALSRRHEFEADEFATRQSDGKALIAALVRLYRDNANTLTPDPVYSAFYDSHPPAPVRIGHLRRLIEKRPEHTTA
ncbi:MAG: M48 family metallopeptidase [Gammaproteobacteria bacterium]|jgi:STE24 endopeptidase